ncbi:MAG: TIGR03086 family metal-binding protein [Geodermatophilaceae bacterium]
MTTMLDLGPPAQQLTTLLEGLTDDQLAARTPCERSTVGDLLDHLMGLTLAFTFAAQKAGDPAQSSSPPGWSVRNLAPDWRTRLPRQLEDLVAAWREPDAWEGMTEAGGVTLPAEVMGSVAMDELVLHSWDLARGTGQPFEPDPASTAVVLGFTSAMSEPGQDAAREGLFGPVVDVPVDEPDFQRALGLSGRDPYWESPQR